MNVLERLEALAEKATEVDWDYEELVTVNTALPDLLNLARAVSAHRIAMPTHVWLTLEPLLREAQP